MLVLTRRKDEEVLLSGPAAVIVLGIDHGKNRVKLGFRGPHETIILGREVAAETVWPPEMEAAWEGT